MQEWAHDGLDEPEEVLAATSEYRHDSDVIGQFIDECCVVDPVSEVGATQLHKRYKEWCEANGQRYANQTVFGGELESKGYVRNRRGGRVYRQGISLVETVSTGH